MSSVVTTGRTRLSGPFVPESAAWPQGIYQLQTDDAVLGGDGGFDNFAPQSLADRTAWLRAQIEAVLAAVGLPLDINKTTQLQQAIADQIGDVAVPVASTTISGKIRLATLAETLAGLADNIAVSPAVLATAIVASSPSGVSYFKVPSGHVVLWGAVTATPSGTAGYFPVAFPSQALAIAGIGVTNQPAGFSITQLSQVGANFYTGSSGGLSVFYIAVGK